MAEPKEPAAAANPRSQFARFAMDGHAYAIDIMRVKEVLNPTPLTPLPTAPPFVEGLLELRGQFLPVIDLRRHLLGLDAPTGPNKILVATFGEQLVGLGVDSVTDVFRIEPEQIQPLSGVTESPALTGVIRRDEEAILIFDVDGLLSDVERGQLLDIT